MLGFTVGTLRKKCATGKQPGAFKTSVTSGDWRIPFGVLRPLIAARQSA